MNREGVEALLVLAIVVNVTLHLSGSPTNESVVIVNSGSTNLAGFRIVVERSGVAEYTPMQRKFGPLEHEKRQPAKKDLPSALRENLFKHLEDAKPLSSLPRPHCMKSASFGSTLTVEFGGEKTPDLSCGAAGNSSFEAIVRDVNEVVGLFRAK